MIKNSVFSFLYENFSYKTVLLVDKSEISHDRVTMLSAENLLH